MAQQLAPQDYANLKRQGFSDQEISSALREVEMEELQTSQAGVRQGQMKDPRQYSQQSSFATPRDDNLVKWQLELNDILERAEHILKGDKPKFQDGHVVWNANPRPQDNPLNDRGVEEIMKILSMYINRNTILSDYTQNEINFKVYDAGRRLNNLLFMRYDEFGMDNEDKRKHYEMIVGELVDMIHSAFKRALDGSEKRSLREMINVQQSTQLTGVTPQGVTVNAGAGMMPQSRGLLNPLRYIAGKYK